MRLIRDEEKGVSPDVGGEGDSVVTAKWVVSCTRITSVSSLCHAAR